MAETDQAVKEKSEEAVENGAGEEDSKTQAQSVEFSEAAGGTPGGASSNIDVLLDTSIPVTVAIGQTEMPIQQLLQLEPGSVLKLDKPIDSPVDLYLKNVRFATGSVVVVEEQFAVRIKQILGTGAAAKQSEA